MSHSRFIRSLTIPSSLLCALLLEAPTVVEAQAKDGARPTSQQTPPSPTAPRSAPTPPAPPEKRTGRPVNIKIELVLTDSADGKVIAEERLNTVLADLQLGRVRRRNGPPAGLMSGPPPVTNRIFEIDITPEIVVIGSETAGQRIKVTMTMNYMAPAGPVGEDQRATVNFVENVSTFLESGKEM